MTSKRGGGDDYQVGGGGTHNRAQKSRTQGLSFSPTTFFANATFGSRPYYPHGEHYSLSGDHKVYPAFWKAFTTSYVNLNLGSWPVLLTRTVVDDCGEKRNVLVPPTLHHHNGLSLSAGTGSQGEIRSVYHYETDTGDCLVCKVRFPSNRFPWLTWKP
jgi:hypothetical protein